MAKPPPSGPHSDLEGVNQDGRVGTPSRNPANGTAKEKQSAEEHSAGRPAKSATRKDA